MQEEIVAEVGSYQKIIDGARQVVAGWKPQVKVDADWPMVALGEIGKISMCKRVFKKETASTGEIPFYKIGTFGSSPDSYISKELYNEYREKYPFPKKGDILLSASGTIGKKVIYTGEPAYFQDSNIVWVDNDESRLLNKFLYYFYTNVKWPIETGVTIARLYKNDLEKILVPLPPLEVQKQIVAEIGVEQGAVEACRRLIGIYEGKVRDSIGGVWGEV